VARLDERAVIRLGDLQPRLHAEVVALADHVHEVADSVSIASHSPMALSVRRSMRAGRERAIPRDVHHELLEPPDALGLLEGAAAGEIAHDRVVRAPRSPRASSRTPLTLPGSYGRAWASDRGWRGSHPRTRTPWARNRARSSSRSSELVRDLVTGPGPRGRPGRRLPSRAGPLHPYGAEVDAVSGQDRLGESIDSVRGLVMASPRSAARGVPSAFPRRRG